MTPTPEKTESTKETEVKDEKREFINVQVTKEQKQAITKHAIVSCGISVSEYGRTKMLDFSEAKKEPVKTESSDLTDDERSLYEEGMRNGKDRENALEERNKQYVAEIAELKSILSNEKPIIPESSIVIELTPEQRDIVDQAIKYEAGSFFGDDYGDILYFIKKKIGDLVTSNSSSYPDEYQEKGTPEYKIATEFIQFLKGETAKSK